MTVIELRPRENTPSGPTCAYCGGVATVMDHVWARSDGGPNNTTNLVDACIACNSSKRDAPLAEWLSRLVLLPGSERTERTQRIVARLASGEISSRVGNPCLGWMWRESSEDEGEDNYPLPATLEDCIVELAYNQLWSDVHSARIRSEILAVVLGERWNGYHGALTDLWMMQFEIRHNQFAPKL